MKISNIFKKKRKSEVKENSVQKMNHNQLEKVVGGGDGDLTSVPPSIRGVIIDKKIIK